MKLLSRFGGLLSVLYAVLGVLVRLRVIFSAPLPPAQPVRYVLAGLASDLIVGVLIAAIFAFVFARIPRVGMVALSLLLGFVLIVQLAIAEATVFLAHTVRGEDLETGFHPRLFLGSAGGGVLFSAALLAAAFTGAAVWAYRRRNTTSTDLPKVAIAAVAVLLLRLLLPLPEGAGAAQNALVSLPSMLRNARIDKPAVTVAAPSMDVRAARELAGSQHGEFVSNDYPLAQLPPARSQSAVQLAAGPPPNIVILMLESVRAEEVGAFGGEPRGVTPNLDAIAKEGIRVERAYSTGSITPEGELGVLYGALTSPWEIIIRSRPKVRLTGLPDILAANGWSPFLWMHSSDATVYLSSRFYRERGVRVIDGRDFPSSDPSTGWGYSDRALMRHALEALDRMKPPFGALVLTISNHHPFKVPDDAQTQVDARSSFGGELLGHHTTALLQTIHYTDEAVGDFFRAARKQPWFQNTVFVISGDHGTTVPAAGRRMTRHVFYELRHRVPIIIYSPRLPHGLVLTGPASQTDILPTLLGLAGIRTPAAIVGHDVLDPAQQDASRPVISWDLWTRTVTVQRGRFSYHATLSKTGSLGDELLVDTEKDPDGTRNLIAADRDVATACRRAATIYIATYGWLLANDRLTIPPAKTGERR